MATTKRQGSAAPPGEQEPNAAMEQAKADLAAARASKEATHTLPIHAKLAKVQAQLRVAKNRGKGHNPNAQVTYEYRNSEDILATVKPLCAEVGAVVVVDVAPTVIGESVPVEIRTVGKDRYGSDIFAMISGPRFAAVATAMFVDVATGASVKASAFAFIDSWRKGQTEPEKLCGSADSYASKYALCHLFAIDNERDADEESDEMPRTGAARPNNTPTKTQTIPKQEIPDV